MDHPLDQVSLGYFGFTSHCCVFPEGFQVIEFPFGGIEDVDYNISVVYQHPFG
jgi:hypothetical protein